MMQEQADDDEEDVEDAGAEGDGSGAFKPEGETGKRKASGEEDGGAVKKTKAT